MANGIDTENVKPRRVRRDRREEILAQATDLFGKYGFQGTSLALVAEAVGLTEQGVLHYFPSKVHLLQGVLEYHEHKELEKYSKHIAAERTSIPDIFRVLEEVVAEDERIPGLIQLFTVLVAESIRIDHPSHEYFVDRYQRGREMYVSQFKKLNLTGTRPDLDLDGLASLIMAVMDGLQIQWLLDPGQVDIVKTFKLFSQIMVEYLNE